MVFNKLSGGRDILSAYYFSSSLYDRPYEQIANLSDRMFLFRDVA